MTAAASVASFEFLQPPANPMLPSASGLHVSAHHQATMHAFAGGSSAGAGAGAGAGAAAAAGAGAAVGGPPPATMLTCLDEHVFKSVRDNEDRLNSSALEVEFQLTPQFADKCNKLVDACHSRRPSGSLARATKTALKAVVAVETLYHDGQVPVAYDDASAGLLPVDNPDLEFRLRAGARRLTVCVERNFPLSSSHAGRPFKLAFVFDGHCVQATTPFLVMAKAPKRNTTLKPRKPKPARRPMNADRECTIRAIRASGAAGPASGICCLSVAPDAPPAAALGSASPPSDSPHSSTAAVHGAAVVAVAAAAAPPPVGQVAQSTNPPRRTSRRRKHPMAGDAGTGAGAGAGFGSGTSSPGFEAPPQPTANKRCRHTSDDADDDDDAAAAALAPDVSAAAFDFVSSPSAMLELTPTLSSLANACGAAPLPFALPAPLDSVHFNEEFAREFGSLDHRSLLTPGMFSRGASSPLTAAGMPTLPSPSPAPSLAPQNTSSDSGVASDDDDDDDGLSSDGGSGVVLPTEIAPSAASEALFAVHGALAASSSPLFAVAQLQRTPSPRALV